jgi:hypothetical protein
MADRLAAAGGTLCTRSAPGLGTTISGRRPRASQLKAAQRGQVTPPDSPDQHGLFVTPIWQLTRLNMRHNARV